jgi:hypothetical protein
VTAGDELRDYAAHHEWAFEELVMSEKMLEHNQLSNGGTKAMFEYLKDCYGSGGAVLKALRHIIKEQRERRKTLWKEDDGT